MSEEKCNTLAQPAYLNSPHGRIFVQTPMGREALRHLAMMPYEVSSLIEACRQIAVILDLLCSDEETFLMEVFDDALAKERDGRAAEEVWS